MSFPHLKTIPPKTVGLILAITGFSIFAFNDVCLKITSAEYDPFEVALYMNIFTTVFLIPCILLNGSLRKIMQTNEIKKHAMRSYFMLMNFLCIIYAFSQMPLATAYTIVFCLPFIVNILALTFLKERISLHRWLAIMVGMIGILIALRPGIIPFSLAVFAAALGTFFNASSVIVTKHMSTANHWLSYVTYVMIFQTPVLVVIVLYRGGSLLPNLTDISIMPWFVMAGICYVAALSAIPMALKKIDASVVGSLIYLVFPWGLFYGYFIFDDVPDRWTLLGAVIIIASGLFLIYCERVENKKNLNIEEI